MDPHPGYEIADTGDGHITRARGDGDGVVGWRQAREPDPPPPDLPGSLPPGIHRATRCPTAAAHAPHLWARGWDVIRIRPGTDPPPDALWCDGQAS